MIPKVAIEKAIEGGWNDRLYRVDMGNRSVWTHSEALVLDPAFWQALGRALGWEEYHWKHDRTTQHRFYDLVLTGGDTEAYWNELLKV